MPIETLTIREQDWYAMLEDVLARLPNEACGILGGRDGRVQLVIPVTNVEQSPVRYRMDPQEQLQAMLRIEEEGMQIVGIYHSHPQGPAGPSATDRDQAYYPDSAYLIWFPVGAHWTCRAYCFAEGEAQEIALSRSII